MCDQENRKGSSSDYPCVSTLEEQKINWRRREQAVAVHRAYGRLTQRTIQN